MKIIYSISFFLLLFLLFSRESQSRSFRVAQIPNGTVNHCSNCHVSPGGGGARTPFGNLIKDNYLDNGGNVIWNSELAMLDTDGDGFTNGEELQDPNGVWTSELPDPGDPSLVTNPGDSESFPVSVFDGQYLPENLILSKMDVYPNPANSNSVLKLILNQSGFITAELFSVEGIKVGKLFESNFTDGEHNIPLNSGQININNLQNGAYILNLNINNLTVFRKIIISK